MKTNLHSFACSHRWIWILQDLLGIAFCLNFMKTISLSNFKVVVVESRLPKSCCFFSLSVESHFLFPFFFCLLIVFWKLHNVSFHSLHCRSNYLLFISSHRSVLFCWVCSSYMMSSLFSSLLSSLRYEEMYLIVCVWTTGLSTFYTFWMNSWFPWNRMS